MHFAPRLVGYFEISMHPCAKNSNVTCIGIGLTVDSCFSVDGVMPGWDSKSYGYHGDDGGFYHADGLAREAWELFGPGDAIVCGIDYVHESIFITNNGQFMGRVIRLPQRRVLRKQWYPVVGIDSHRPVTLNFGHSPFVFDLARHCYRGSPHAVEMLRTSRPPKQYYLRNRILQSNPSHGIAFMSSVR